MSYEPLQLDNRDRKISFAVDAVELEGDLHLPDTTRGIVVFAHGSNSSRHSLRNRYIARVLQRHGLGTFLIDLRTPESDRDSQNYQPFDVSISVARLLGATDWLLGNPVTRSLPLGYLGANVGSGAALIAATQRPDVVSAIVTRGRSPELDTSRLAKVEAPTLLVTGGRDRVGLTSNEVVLKQLPAARLAMVPGATHHFEEPCALDTVAQLAGEWFRSYLPTDDEDFRLPDQPHTAR